MEAAMFVGQEASCTLATRSTCGSPYFTHGHEEKQETETGFPAAHAPARQKNTETDTDGDEVRRRMVAYVRGDERAESTNDSDTENQFPAQPSCPLIFLKKIRSLFRITYTSH
jgi:hypothetical protein